MKLNKELRKLMVERFGKDTVIALATINLGIPYVRNVNAYYENGVFYIITHACSGKMKHIEKNSTVAIAGEWFTAHGKGINLGFFGKEENCEIADKLKKEMYDGRNCFYGTVHFNSSGKFTVCSIQAKCNKLVDFD